jgi:hypothetical protein
MLTPLLTNPALMQQQLQVVVMCHCLQGSATGHSGNACKGWLIIL